MLAQNFKTAAELDISEEQYDALLKVLSLMDAGKLRHVPVPYDMPDEGERLFSHEFNMCTFGISHKCGTVACIAGTAELISGIKFVGDDRPQALSDLFYGEQDGDCAVSELSNVTPEQAAIALRSYLTTGDARWDLALAD